MSFQLTEQEFYHRWKDKLENIPQDKYEYIDKFITAYIIHNFLYNLAIELKGYDRSQYPQRNRDQKKAIEIPVKLLTAEKIINTDEIYENAETIKLQVTKGEFFIWFKKDEDWLKQMENNGDCPEEQEEYVKGILKAIYGLRCNTFHGQKNLIVEQDVMLKPATYIIMKINEMMYKELGGKEKDELEM